MIEPVLYWNLLTVIDATEQGHSGTLGKHGYFAKTEAEIPEIVDRNMSKYLK